MGNKACVCKLVEPREKMCEAQTDEKWGLFTTLKIKTLVTNFNVKSV